MTNCPHCKSPNYDSAMQCTHCGRPLKVIYEQLLAIKSQSSEKNLTVCPDCHGTISPTAMNCPHCGRKFEPAGGIGAMVAVFLWLGNIGGVLIGAFILITGMAGAKSAPQEAVVCCLAIACAVLPYCLARAITEVVRIWNE